MYTTNISTGTNKNNTVAAPVLPFRLLYSLGVEVASVSNSDPCLSNALCGHRYELVGRALSKGVGNYVSATNTIIHLPPGETRLLNLAESNKPGTLLLRSDDELCFLWGISEWLKTSVVFLSGFLPKEIKLSNPNAAAVPIHLILASEVPLVSVSVGNPLEVAQIPR